MADLDQLEKRIRGLEVLAGKLIALAREHPLGRAILRRLDIGEEGPDA